MTSGQMSLLAMAVVVPAHNEETLLARCLESLRVAMEQLTLPSVAVVVLDRCTDASARVAHAFATTAPLVIVEGAFSSVGSVRDAGVHAARDHFRHVSAGRMWVANTDADSVVPSTWLLRQHALADSGMDMVLGTVEPGPSEANHAPANRLWFERHRLLEGHHHVHGANLGIRLSELELVRGFGNVSLHEDVGLARRVQHNHERWVATDSIRVVTSSRRQGRIQDGFAGYLRDLDRVVSNAEAVFEEPGVSG